MRYRMNNDRSIKSKVIQFFKIYWPLVLWAIPLVQILNALSEFGGYEQSWIYTLIGNSADKGGLTWLIVPFVSVFWLLPIFLIPYVRKNFGK